MNIDKIRNTYKGQWVTYLYGCGCSAEELVSDILLLEVEPGRGCVNPQCYVPVVNRADYVESIEVEDECNT